MRILANHYNAGKLYIGYTDGIHECSEIIEEDEVKNLLLSEGYAREIRGKWANVPIPHEKGTPTAYQWLHLDNFIRDNLDNEMAERLLSVYLKKTAV